MKNHFQIPLSSSEPQNFPGNGPLRDDPDRSMGSIVNGGINMRVMGNMGRPYVIYGNMSVQNGQQMEQKHLRIFLFAQIIDMTDYQREGGDESLLAYIYISIYH